MSCPAIRTLPEINDMAENPHNSVTRSFYLIPLLMAFDDPVRPQDQNKKNENKIKKVVSSRPLGTTEKIQKYVTAVFVFNDTT